MGSHHLIEALVEEGDWPADTRRLICPHCNEEVVILGCMDANQATCTDAACPVCHGSGWYYPELGDECRACGTDLVPDPRFIENDDEDDDDEINDGGDCCGGHGAGDCCGGHGGSENA